MEDRTHFLQLISQFKELGIDKQIDYDKFYLYSMITHSTAIEGSTVTEVENQLLFDEGISAKGRSMMEQLMNLDLKTAYEQALIYANNKRVFTVGMLKELSALVMKNSGTIYNTMLGSFSSANGDLRLLNVTAGVGDSSYMNYTKVPDKLQELCVWINEMRSTINRDNIIECYQLSFDTHYKLVTIHPWADGNGRMARLIMNLIQLELGVIPSIIHSSRKAEYIEALIATREIEDINIFRKFMFEEHTTNLNNMIINYKNSIEKDDCVDVPINVPINSRENMIIDIISTDAAITTRELAERLNVSERTIKRHISSLKERNIITRKGSNKSGRWQIH